MDEMQLLKDYGRSAGLVPADELSQAHARLLAEMSAEPTARPLRTSLRYFRRSRTPRLLGLSRRNALVACAISAAAVVTAVAVLAPDTLGGNVPAANAEAAQVLDRAAVVVLAEPFVEPRPDQFLYVRQEGAGEVWLSVDGTHDGLILSPGNRDLIPGCRNGKKDAIKGDRVVGTEVCAPEPAYLPDLPTDVNAMHQYLRTTYLPDSEGFTNRLAKGIKDLFLHYLRPQARAALLQAAGRFPGLTVIHDAADELGRHGIGIAWSSTGYDNLFLLDPNTYKVVGPKLAIVDHVEQRP